MIWTTKTPPVVGDTRIVTRFAFIPVGCNDGYTRWLCRIRLMQKRCVTTPAHGGRQVWATLTVQEWVA